MTSVEIKYNPFKTKTDIYINDGEIAKTSNLYRYRNTPLEDWVDVLIPELVEYCNDDEISLRVCSIQKYIDDINDQIKAYSKKHRHVDIEVEECASTGYKGRLAKIYQIQESVTPTITLEESCPDIQVLVVSMAGKNEYSQMIEVLVGRELDVEEGFYISNFQHDEEGFSKVDVSISEIDDKYINIEVLIYPCLQECVNKYWRLLKEKTSQSKNYMLLAQLNSNPKKNDELYRYLLDQLEKKGQLNKARFIFITDNMDDNDEYLRDEYGVRNITMLENINVESAFSLVKEYIQNVCYRNKIVSMEHFFRNGLWDIQGAIARETEKNKCIDEINHEKEVYRRQADTLIQHFNSLTLISNKPKSIDTLTDYFIEDLTIQLRELVKKIAITGLWKKGTSDLFAREEYTFVSAVRRATIGTVISELSRLFASGQYKEDVKRCVEERVKAHVYEYLKGKSVLMSDATVLEEGIILATDYPVMNLIEEAIDVEQYCNAFINQLGDIKKRTEYSSNVEFYTWVIGGIDFRELARSLGGFIYMNDNPNDYSAVDRGIKRRLKTVEDKIKEFFREIEMSTGINILSKVLERKKKITEELINTNVACVIQKIDAYEKQWDISAEEIAKLANIDVILSELDKVIEL